MSESEKCPPVVSCDNLKGELKLYCNSVIDDIREHKNNQWKLTYNMILIFSLIPVAARMTEGRLVLFWFPFLLIAWSFSLFASVQYLNVTAAALNRSRAIKDDIQNNHECIPQYIKDKYKTDGGYRGWNIDRYFMCVIILAAIGSLIMTLTFLEFQLSPRSQCSYKTEMPSGLVLNLTLPCRLAPSIPEQPAHGQRCDNSVPRDALMTHHHHRAPAPPEM